ncbi:hypothetical protein AA16373_2630 [Komagataeibacter swingsii DSM 16373]|nr:hypothetical protein AA16373_2630 [Komagataeibacter swingsii DSM 16373]
MLPHDRGEISNGARHYNQFSGVDIAAHEVTDRFYIGVHFDNQFIHNALHMRTLPRSRVSVQRAYRPAIA